MKAPLRTLWRVELFQMKSVVYCSPQTTRSMKIAQVYTCLHICNETQSMHLSICLPGTWGMEVECVRDCTPNRLHALLFSISCCCLCRFGGGFTEWGQPFRLRHVVTGRFLGVRLVCRANCGGKRKEDTEEEGGGVGKSRRESQAGKVEEKHIAVLLEPSEATFKATAFCFTDTTVSYTFGVLQHFIHVCIRGVSIRLILHAICGLHCRCLC